MAVMIGSSTLRGSINASPSKSYTHRAMILGALSGSGFSVIRPLLSEDTRATLSALAHMGAEVQEKDDSVAIHCQTLSAPQDDIDCGNSGTSIRLLTGVAGLLDSEIVLTGDDSIRKRPMKPLLDALRELGVACSGVGDAELPPVRIRGPMKGELTRIHGGMSSQFVSSLLIACPMKPTKTRIEVTGERKSMSYIDITLFCLNAFGVSVSSDRSGYWMDGNQRPRGDSFVVPGDFSSASFPLVGAAITNGEVSVERLNAEMPQGDVAIVEALREFGAEIEISDDSIRCSSSDRRPFEIDVSRTPDLFPILAVMAASAMGDSRIYGGEHLRFKESNRIDTTVRMLRSLGVSAEASRDGCLVHGRGRIRGGVVDTFSDHRIMMSAVIAGLASEEGVNIQDDSSHRVSYPAFMDDIEQLGGRIELVS